MGDIQIFLGAGGKEASKGRKIAINAWVIRGNDTRKTAKRYHESRTRKRGACMMLRDKSMICRDVNIGLIWNCVDRSFAI